VAWILRKKIMMDINVHVAQISVLRATAPTVDITIYQKLTNSILNI